MFSALPNLDMKYLCCVVLIVVSVVVPEMDGLTTGTRQTDSLTTDTRQSQSCSTSADCETSSCCLSPIIRDGRRQVGGSCVARGSDGGSCYVRNDQLLKDHDVTLYLDLCPCQPDLACVGTGMYEVPQGEQGICTPTAGVGR
ncbi:uncharacterized protein LOC131949426 [Physella acuta]|uniref:uncharacterized protein LOC131949426 n=1 Tax=Physella acuta TaxID=109671 RepID=UPI0027DE6FE0|nr:uncharacterized protein LOC131949426 [Physella acuta]